MNEKQKLHVLRLPTPEYSNPPATDTEIAISIPIFHSNIDSNSHEFDTSRFKEIHLKSAVWAALSLINNTDLTDNGVGIYFHIEDTIADVALEAFKQYGISLDAIRVQPIPNPEAKDIKCTQYGKKLMCLADETLKPKRWLILDSDAFACSTQSKMRWYEPLCEVDQPVAMWSFPNFYTVGKNYEQWVRGACLGAGFDFDPLESSYKQEQKAFERLGFLDETLPPNPIETPDRHMIASQILVIPTAHEITPFLQHHYANCYQDEFLLAMWHLKHKDILPLNQVIKDIEMHHNESTYIGRDRSKDADGYIAHIAADDRIEQTKVNSYFDEFYNALLPKEQISEAYTNVSASLAETTSDKEVVNTFGHKYGKLYDLIFNDLSIKKGDKLRILEVGVSYFGAGSLEAFQQLENVESVVGVDVLPYQGKLTDKAVFHQVNDAYTPAAIQMLKETHPPFDLIIDDGSHETHHQEFFLLNYDQLLSDNGKLLCEDISDKAFFRRMCRDHGAYGFDGWANLWDEEAHNVNERILLRDKPLPLQKQNAASVAAPVIAPKSVRFPDYTAPKTQLTFHVPGIAYAPTDPEFNTDPFVQKIWKQCALLKNLGHNVKHYGHERSNVACTEHIDTTDDFIVKKTYGELNHTPKNYSVANDLAFNIFDANTEREIRKRANAGDFLLLSFPHQKLCESLSDTGMYAVESGIGYEHVYSQYKVFESYAWMHYHRGRAAKTYEVIDKFPDLKEVHQVITAPHNVLHQNEPDWTSCVIPNYFDLSQFEYREKKDDYMLFIGRITQNKGLEIAFALAEYTNTRLLIAGPGDINQLGYYVPPQAEYVGIADVEKRSELMAGAMAVICPSIYIEPFLGVHIEAAIAGTAVLTTNWGAPTEYLIDGKTGFRCQNFDQFVWAFEHLDEIKPSNCRKHALQFSNERVSLKYHEFFHMVDRYAKGQFWSVDPKRTRLDWLTAEMTEDEIQSGVKEIQTRINEEDFQGLQKRIKASKKKKKRTKSK